jgi:hypothetical protein
VGWTSQSTNNDARAGTTFDLAGIVVVADNVSSVNTLRAEIDGNMAEGGPFGFGFLMKETAGSTLELLETQANFGADVNATNTPLTPAVNADAGCAIIAGPIDVPSISLNRSTGRHQCFRPPR